MTFHETNQLESPIILDLLLFNSPYLSQVKNITGYTITTGPENYSGHKGGHGSGWYIQIVMNIIVWRIYFCADPFHFVRESDSPAKLHTTFYFLLPRVLGWHKQPILHSHSGLYIITPINIGNKRKLTSLVGGKLVQADSSTTIQNALMLALLAMERLAQVYMQPGI